jgi:hypothetical protein
MNRVQQKLRKRGADEFPTKKKRNILAFDLQEGDQATQVIIQSNSDFVNFGSQVKDGETETGSEKFYP